MQWILNIVDLLLWINNQFNTDDIFRYWNIDFTPTCLLWLVVKTLNTDIALRRMVL